MKQRAIAITCLVSLMFVCGAVHAADSLCPRPSTGNGQVQAVITAIKALQKTLTAGQRSALERPFVRESAIRWSNLPIGVVPRTGLRLGDLDVKQEYAARRVAAAALSAYCRTQDARRNPHCR